MVMRLSVRVCCSSWQVCIGRLSTSSSSGLPGGLYFQGGGHAPQVPQVSACPVHSLKPPTSPGARARLTRHSQVAMASDIARAVTLLQPLDGLLICNGLAALDYDARHLERLLSGGVTWPDRTVEATVRRCHAGSVAWPVHASPVGPRVCALWEKLPMCRPCHS